MKYQIEMYESVNGRIPIRDFLKDLQKRNPKLTAHILQDIELLADFGYALREPHVKYMQDGLFELRSRFGSDIARTFYFFFSQNRIVLTNVFIKKTQKTPLEELQKALKYKKDYEQRHNQL